MKKNEHLQDNVRSVIARVGILISAICCLIAFAAFGFSGSSWANMVSSSPGLVEDSETSLEVLQKIKIAYYEHELILLLIDDKQFDKIELELKKIFDLKLGDKYEGALAKSLLTIAFKLSEAEQLDLANKILDDGLANVNFSNQSKSEILRFKAYLFKEAGDIDSAIEAITLAEELNREL